jgi:hypothetical protein
MSWQKEVEELRRRQSMAEAMGGPDGIATRGHLVEFVHDAQRILAGQLGPPVMPYLP